jgi:signal transduction histidine kinase
MRMASEPSKPSFLWQAALILLPVAVLAVIGWASLRQDKVLAEHDAQQRAQALADQLAPALWTQLVVSPEESTNQAVFQVDEAGKLIFPAPYDSTPAPAPFPLEKLSPEQARLWVLSQNSTFSAATDAANACQRLIDSKPPERFAAAAQYQLGLLLLQQGKTEDAVNSLEVVAKQYPDVVGESGLLLSQLAQFKMVQLQPFSRDLQYKTTTHSAPARNGVTLPDLQVEAQHFISLDTFCSNIVSHPSPLTAYLLAQTEQHVKPLPQEKQRPPDSDGGKNTWNLGDQTNKWETVQKWQRVWAEHERAREIYASASNHLRPNPPFLPIGTNQIGSAPVPSFFWFIVARQSRGWKVPGAQMTWRESSDGDQILTIKEDWLAVGTSTNRFHFVCRPAYNVTVSLMENTAHLPDYFGVGVELAGRQLTGPTTWNYAYVPGGKGGGQYEAKKYSDAPATNLLATATYPNNGQASLRVLIFLTNPGALYASQQSRALWFGLLVIVSTIAALIGLIAAWRAFHRQLRLTEMKSNFVSSVSHELRAPIASVRLMAESLERGKVAEPQKQNEYFRFIVQECRRLSSLIENVLDFSRIEQGRKQYEFEPTDLLALTRETVKLMEPYAEEKGVRLELGTANIESSSAKATEDGHRTPNAELEVDGRAIQQALVNLIDNAIKHSAKGQVVRIGIEEVSSQKPPIAATDLTPDPSHLTPSTRLTLFVEDSGPGIPPAEHEKIFERFYRLGSELRRETQGVGIGLSIVRHIVEAHGGKVTVRSNVGEGSRFTIVLPVKTIEATDEHG